MQEFGRHFGVPPERIAQLHNSLTREIADFTVSFVLDQQVLGSGTLVTASGIFGILTATHVAEKFTGRKAKMVGLVISQATHQFILRPEYIESIDIFEHPNIAPEVGPDITFLRILAPDDKSNISRFKSAYLLDGRSFKQFDGFPVEELEWWVGGAPAEMSRSQGERGTASHILVATHWVGEAKFVSIETRSTFDLLKLKMLSGQHNFPQDYGGVSGGGMWFSALTMDPDKGFDTLGYQSPFLVGVAFFQTEPKDGERIIVGHGPATIYESVFNKLKE